MNNDDAFEQLATDLSTRIEDGVAYVRTDSSHPFYCRHLILEALHKAVEPYKAENAALRKQVEELRVELEQWKRQYHAANRAFNWQMEQKQQLQAENERLKSACQKSGDVI